MQKTCLYRMGVVLTLPWLLAGTIAGQTKGPAESKTATGTIVGTVRYVGTVPPDQKIFTTDGSTILHNDLMVDAKTKGLRDVMVSLKDAQPQPKVQNARPVIMDQKEMIFIPRVVAMQHGQQVIFTNSDLCNHGVMTFTKVKENQFNIFTPVDQPFKFTFALQEKPVVLGCALHSWMRGWVYIVPHPWFDVTDRQGKFTIRDVPSGTYTLSFQHPDTGTQEQRKIEVKAGQSVSVQVEWQKAGKK